MSRFFVTDVDEAARLLRDVDPDTSDYRNFLLERLPGGNHRLVEIDGGEPEDQTLCRDYKWVEVELNRVSEEGAAAVLAERERVLRVIEAAVEHRSIPVAAFIRAVVRDIREGTL